MSVKYNVLLKYGVRKRTIHIESISYLFVAGLSWVFFKEKITWRKAGAIAMIMMGVVVFFT